MKKDRENSAPPDSSQGEKRPLKKPWKKPKLNELKTDHTEGGPSSPGPDGGSRS